MADLQALLGDAVLLAEIDDALERLLVIIGIEPGAFVRDAADRLTLVISVITSAAAPSEKLPRCIRCQSLAEPSVELYWHIGETTTRLGNVSPRKVIGENSALAILQVSYSK